MSKNEHEIQKNLQRPDVSLLKLFIDYFLVGMTAFSMAIIQKLKSLVLQRKWMNDEEINEGLALVQLYPGPMMVDFTAYVGYKLRGVAGAVVATVGFILPSFFMMLTLSYFYFKSAHLAWIHLLFTGLDALVIGVILNVTFDMGAKIIKGKIEAVVALLAFALLLFKINALWVVVAALLLGALLLRPTHVSNNIPRSNAPVSKKRWTAISLISFFVIGVAVFLDVIWVFLGGMALWGGLMAFYIV